MSEEPTLEETDIKSSDTITGGFSGSNTDDEEPVLAPPEPAPEPEKAPEPPAPKKGDSCKLKAEGTFENGIASCNVKKGSKIDMTRVQQFVFDVDGIKYVYVKTS